jgi:glutamine amidotransferase
MCRHFAYLGPRAGLHELIFGPPHGLYRQSYRPRRQRHGEVNVDGFGAGWYAGDDPVPVRYRRAGPVWADPSFADVARVTHSSAVLAAVRSASAGTEPGASAAAPYGADRWLFSHNGSLEGWPASAVGLAETLSAGELLGLEARCDSALLWALTLHQLRAGAGLADALAITAGLIASHQVAGRFNMLLTDGSAVAATAIGETLCYRREPGRLLVASEPHDDEPGWTDVPDGSLLSGTSGTLDIRPLSAVSVSAGTASAGTASAGAASTGTASAGTASDGTASDGTGPSPAPQPAG